MAWMNRKGADGGFARPLTVALALLALSACTSASPPPPPELDRSLGGDLVTREEIENAGARTVWDVFRCCTRLRLKEDREGNPTSISHRGTNSLVLEDTPLIFIDGVRAVDIISLDFMPAEDILAIRVLSGAEAGLRYGFGADNGVIEIYTRRR